MRIETARALTAGSEVKIITMCPALKKIRTAMNTTTDPTRETKSLTVLRALLYSRAPNLLPTSVRAPIPKARYIMAKKR